MTERSKDTSESPKAGKQQEAKVAPKQAQAKGKKVKSKKRVDKAEDKDLKKKPAKKRGLRARLLSKVGLVAMANLVGIVFAVLAVGNLPDKAAEFKKLRNMSISAEARSKVEIADLEIKSNIEKSDRLIALFPDETGLVNFVKEIEKLKLEGIVKTFSFANQEAVRDKTTILGIPFVIELEGTWDQIDASLQSLQRLEFLYRAITVQIEPKEEENLINFKYGGFIYVDESLGKD